MRLLLILSLLFSSAAFAAEPEAAAKTASTTKAPSNLTDTRDAFLAFALEKAQSYTDKAEIAVSKAVDMASAEAPVAMQELIRWRLFRHTIKGLAPVLGFLGALWLLNVHWKRFQLNSHGSCLERGTELNVVASVVGWAGMLVCGIATAAVGLGHLMDALQILVAPRIYLIEQVIHLIKR